MAREQGTNQVIKLWNFVSTGAGSSATSGGRKKDEDASLCFYFSPGALGTSRHSNNCCFSSLSSAILWSGETAALIKVQQSRTK